MNPTGVFELGGPHADTGLTGRKIIVDTYGGMARHGGGAFSGKDPSKVDRSAAYAARWVAKHVVASGAAKRCEVQVAYAIGVAQPVSILVETFGTHTVDETKIEEAVREVFDLRPAAIIRDLDLRRPIFHKTAAYGHFGRNDPEFTLGAADQARRLPRRRRLLTLSERPGPLAVAGRPGPARRQRAPQDVRLPRARRARGRGCRWARSCASRSTAGGSAGGSWGWAEAAATGVELKPIAKVTGWGPPPEVLELAEWAAWRWAGPVRGFLATASPPAAVAGLPPAGRWAASPVPGPLDPLAAAALEAGQATVRLPPTADTDGRSARRRRRGANVGGHPVGGAGPPARAPACAAPG